VRDPDELHDVLLSLVLSGPRDDWQEHFEVLVADGRCFEVHQPGIAEPFWAATERRGGLEALFPDARFVPDHALPAGLADRTDADEAGVTAVQGHLEISGPISEEELAAATGLSGGPVKIALETLRGRGFAVSGAFEQGRGEQWCARRLLARIHGYTRERRRAQIRPVSQEQWTQFLESWWHRAPATQLYGRAGVAEVIEQLQGSEWPAGEWERILAARVHSYRPEWLDDLCLAGEVVWGRLSLIERAVEGDGVDLGPDAWTGKTPSRRTPITFMLRQDLSWLLQAHRGSTQPAEATSGPGSDVLRALRTRGALFHSELQTITSRLPTEIEEGLWDGVARGLITADGFNAIRSLLHARTRFARRQRPYARPGSRGRRGGWRHGVEGRWTLLPPAEPIEDVEELAETVACQLLLRWGVVCRDVYFKERLAVPWREILRALRRLEARGLTRGGHFVTGITGEQFANEETIPLLRGRRRTAPEATIRRSA
jgi:ATP-dependent Lhr-like helicase